MIISISQLKAHFVNFSRQQHISTDKQSLWSQWFISGQDQVTLFTNTEVILVFCVCCVSVTLGVPLLCSWVSLMRYQTQTSIHQPHWWGQWGATASVKRGIMAPRVEIGGPCLQRLLSTEGLKRYTTPASTSLCSAKLTFPQGSFLRLLSLWFSGTKTQKKNVLQESGHLIYVEHVCELVKTEGPQRPDWLNKQISSCYHQGSP